MQPGYPEQLDTISDHIRAVRMHRGLFQREVAEILGVSYDAIEYWERKRNEPSIRLMPKISEFLGYCVIREHLMGGWRQAVLNDRWQRGLNVPEYAEILGVDESMVRRVERGRRISKKSRDKIFHFLDETLK